MWKLNNISIRNNYINTANESSEEKSPTFSNMQYLFMINKNLIVN